MASILATQHNARLNGRGARNMPRGMVQQAFVRQPVSLRPAGNTVAMTVRSENPFEGGRNITVVTQASGGMAKPDPKMQSRSLRGMSGLGGWTTRPHSGGFRGLSGLGSLSDEAYDLFMQYDSDAPRMSRADYDADSGKRSYWESEVQKSKAQAAEDAKPFDWAKAGDIFSSTVKTGADIYSQVAKKDLPAGVTQYMPRASSGGSNTMLYVALGGVAVLGVLFFVLRKKSPAA